MTDSIGRAWQMGTIQLDAMMPERLDASYTSADDRQERPFMIHRALFGSFERFIGILIEHFAGAFPIWLAPQQAIVLPISDSQLPYAEEVRDALVEAGLRVTLDDRDEKVGRKIRDAEELKIPAMLVVGEREAESHEVSLRRHGRRNLGARPLGDVVKALADEAEGRWLDDREAAPPEE
jgi:threonyl-tRNA synthetase